MKKIILIEGTSTRYEMKKVTGQTHLEETKLLKGHSASLEKKRSGYKQQDKKKLVFEEEKFVSKEYILSAMGECKMKCFYCKEEMLLEYIEARDRRQWTLDRIDNAKGHNYDNVILACLNCNLKRRCTSAKSYSQEKEMLVVSKVV